MNLFTLKDLRSMPPKDVVVLHYEGTDDSTEYYADDAVKELEYQAIKKIDAGEYDTLGAALDHMERIAYICTKEGYEKETEELQNL